MKGGDFVKKDVFKKTYITFLLFVILSLCFFLYIHYIRFQTLSNWYIAYLIFYIPISLVISYYFLFRNIEWAEWVHENIKKKFVNTNTDTNTDTRNWYWWFTSIITLSLVLLPALITFAPNNIPRVFLTLYSSTYILITLAILYTVLKELYGVRLFINQTKSYNLYRKELFSLLSRTLLRMSIYFFIVYFMTLWVSSIVVPFPSAWKDNVVIFIETYFSGMENPKNLANNKDVANTVISVLATSVLSILIALITFTVYILSAIKSVFQSLEDMRKEKYNYFSFQNLDTNSLEISDNTTEETY